MRVPQEYDIHLGQPSQIELSLLKWSFHDLNLEGLHEFSGTVHMVKPNRLRNDTGQRFGEAVYVDKRLKYILHTARTGAGRGNSN